MFDVNFVIIDQDSRNHGENFHVLLCANHFHKNFSNLFDEVHQPNFRFLINDKRNTQSHKRLINLAGTPPITDRSGKDLVTTDPAAITEFLPISTPLRITTSLLSKHFD